MLTGRFLSCSKASLGISNHDHGGEKLDTLVRIKLFLIHINKTVNVTSVKQKEAKFILVLHFKMHWFYILKYFVPPSHRTELDTSQIC